MKEIIEWSDYTWLTKEPWGRIHPDKAWNHYDKTAVEIDEDNVLHLKTQYNPQKIIHDGEIYHPEYGVGLISSTEKFHFGYFEIEAKLPTGYALWPAFWMYGSPWPPEIDIVEAYTGNRQDYLHFNIHNPLAYNKVESCIHHGVVAEGTKDSMPARAGMIFKDPRKHFIKYGCLWTDTFIKIFYDGKCVRTITDKQILKEMNKPQMILINNHLTKKGLSKVGKQSSDFQIKYFKYYG
jgi:beta-glucanase (GH16 family)